MPDFDDDTDELIVPLRKVGPAPPPAPKREETIADADQNEGDRSEPEGQPRGRAD